MKKNLRRSLVLLAWLGFATYAPGHGRLRADAPPPLLITTYAGGSGIQGGPRADGQITGAADEIITRAAGSGGAGFGGDGGPATSALLRR